MHERALRKILLIQAIEETDRTGDALPLPERVEATRAHLGKNLPALEAQFAARADTPPAGMPCAARPDTPSAAGMPPAASSPMSAVGPQPRALQSQTSSSQPTPPQAPPLSPATETFLTRRAETLLRSLRTRSPGIDHVLAVAGGATSLDRGVLLAAFLAGGLLSFLDRARGIDIFALPLVALIVWNLVIYVSLLRSRPPRYSWFARLYARSVRNRIESLLGHSSYFNAPLAPGLRRFAGDWWEVAQPLFAARARRVLHFGALSTALGLIAGYTLRAEILRANAGWYGGSVLGPDTAHVLISLLYGPALLITGIDTPATEVIRQLRWTVDGGGGEATFWVHLIAWTTGLYIVLPRLLATVWSTISLWRVSRRLAPPPGIASYVRNVLATERFGESHEV